MTGDTDANGLEYNDDTIDFDGDALREAVRSALAEGGAVYREVEVADGITICLDWDTDDRVLPVCIVLDGDRVPETVTDDLVDASSALDGLQADLDAVFYRAMDFGRDDHGNRAYYEAIREPTVDGSVSYHGTISNPSSSVSVA